MVKLALPSLKQSLASPTIFLLVTTVTGYAFAYLYLIAMGRILGPETFGILGALFAIFYIACLIGQALREAIACNVAQIKAKAGELVAVSTYMKLGMKLGFLSLLPCLAFIIAASQPIASFFHLSSTKPIIILAFSLFTALTLDIVLGLQQGLQKFKYLGITGYSTSQGLKLLFGIVFVWIGWDLPGAVAALLASTAIATMVGLVLIRKQLASGARNPARYDAKLVPILVPTLILAVFMAMPSSIDVMLVTHFFGGKEAGLFNAVATIGKVVVFLPMAVSMVLLPKATTNHILGQNTRNILLQGLFYAFILSGGVTLICWGFPDIIVRLFFGEAYTEAGPLITLYAAAMLLFSLNFVLIHYSLAIRNLWLMLLADVITLAEVTVIVLIHQSLSQVIWILLVGNLLILLFSFPYLVLWHSGDQSHSLKDGTIR